MATNLTLHCGGYKASLAEVNQVQTPKASDTHYPVPHQEFVGTFMERMDNAGYKIIQEQHALMNDGMNYFGLFETDIKTSEYALIVGLRNSHIKTYAAGILIGSQLFICDNLAFSGEIKLQRKHTRFVMRDLASVFSRALGKVYDMHTHQTERIEHYKEKELTQAESDHAIIDLLRNRAINSSDVLKVVKAYEEPEHKEFGEDTVWTLFNAATGNDVNKSLVQLPRRTQIIHSVCDEVCGLHKEAA
jgi:hypothetical protein